MREQETEVDDTVEVWGSTPHGPTIQNKDLARIPKKHSRVQKDTFLRPICVLLPETFLLPTALGQVLRRVGDGCTSQLRRKHQRHHSRLRSVLGGRHRLSIDVQRGSQRRMPHQFLHHLEFRADAPQKRRVGPPKSMPSRRVFQFHCFSPPAERRDAAEVLAKIQQLLNADTFPISRARHVTINLDVR